MHQLLCCFKFYVYLESGIYDVESRIQDCPRNPYTGRYGSGLTKGEHKEYAQLNWLKFR